MRLDPAGRLDGPVTWNLTLSGRDPRDAGELKQPIEQDEAVNSADQMPNLVKYPRDPDAPATASQTPAGSGGQYLTLSPSRAA